jgi:hypothetical protein
LDKFGIFKLLTSFYDFYQKNKSSISNNKNGESSSPLPFNLDFLKAKPQENQMDKEPAKKTNQSLYLSMINTISSHDKIVKRVTENANKTKT